MRNVAPLTSLRFFAAFWVLLFHLRIHFGSPQPFLLECFLLAGLLSMTFFFVLSGFILVLSSEGKEPLADFSGYFWRRFARIYPIYLVYLLFFWAFIGFAGNLGDKPILAMVLFGLTDLTLTNAWFPQGFMGGFGRDGSWSLSAEVFFYALFPVILFHARKMSDRMLIVSLRWSIVIAALAPTIGRYLPAQMAIPETVYYSLPIFRLPEFSSGVFYAVWVTRDSKRLPTGRTVIFYMAGLVAFLFLAARFLPSAGFDIMLIPALLVLIAYFLRSQENWASRLLSARPLVFLGEISFSIYLVQVFTISLYRLPGHGAGWMGGVFGCLAMTIILAAVGHLLIEKPARRWILSKKNAL
jgi:peptidoglycan/LPS O-acetylase OafA/YrhL